jgi:charged multivesicular body protein 4
MDTVREQMDLTSEISEAISNPVGMGVMVDEDDLEAELEALEQEELDDRLKGADHVPLHTPASPVRMSAPAHKQAVDEDDEEAQLRQLQAELAM